MPGYRQPGASGSSYTGSGSAKELTSERIAADIAAFNKAGGHIEVLGNTPLHYKSAKAEAPLNPSQTTLAAERSPGKK
jgi:hypothetical protein